MKKVYKYEIHSDGIDISAPGLNPLHVGAVDEHLFLWAEIDDEQAEYRMKVFAYPTGHMTIPSGWFYIGTALMHGGSLVWHVYFAPAQPGRETDG
jgi:hypothetical protein